jgi:hypothetical protein
MSDQQPPQQHNISATGVQQSMLDPETMRRELAIEQAINQRLDDLVRLVNETIATLNSKTGLEKNQFRNLLNVSQQSPSVEVVVNFIRYQIGRSGRDWGKGQNDFGHRVIKDLRGPVANTAQEVGEEVRGKGIAVSDERQQQVHVRLMQLYLGYLNRAFFYGKEMGNFSALQEVTHGTKG